jgi:hypothetical protein
MDVECRHGEVVLLRPGWLRPLRPARVLADRPILTVATPGLLEVAFEHRYSFEADADTRWDGGQFRISVNGGADSEGLTNKQEYQSGTNPTDRDSYLKVERIAVTGETRIEFIAASNLTYTVEYTESLKNVVWHTLADVVAGPTSRTVLVTDPGASAQRFYRLVTPRMSNGN